MRTEGTAQHNARALRRLWQGIQRESCAAAELRHAGLTAPPSLYLARLLSFPPISNITTQ